MRSITRLFKFVSESIPDPDGIKPIPISVIAEETDSKQKNGKLLLLGIHTFEEKL
jgi:hypothetical protein